MGKAWTVIASKGYGLGWRCLVIYPRFRNPEQTLSTTLGANFVNCRNAFEFDCVSQIEEEVKYMWNVR